MYGEILPEPLGNPSGFALWIALNCATIKKKKVHWQGVPFINFDNFAISTRQGSLGVKGTVPNSYSITKSGLNGFIDF